LLHAEREQADESPRAVSATGIGGVSMRWHRGDLTGFGGDVRATRLSPLVLTAGCALVAVHATGLVPLLESLTFPVLAVVAAIGTIAGLKIWKPRPRGPWVLIALTFGIFLVGGAFREVLHTLGDRTAGRSLLPDLIIIPGYGVLAAAFAWLAHARRLGRSGKFDIILDATIASLSGLTLAWLYLIAPALAQEHVPMSIRLLLAAYPTLSVFILSAGMQIAFASSAKPPPAFRLLLIAIASMLVGDVVYMIADAGLAHVPVTLLDTPYALAFVFSTAAVLHPSMRQLTEPVRTNETAPTPGRLLAVALALALPALAQLHHSQMSRGDRRIAAAIIVSLAAAAVCRQFRALRQHARSEALLAHQAAHDTLTSLPNGTFLREHLAFLLARAEETRTGIALVLIDLDRFRLVNDSLGHSLGDRVLRAVADRIRLNLPTNAVLTRVGGDEYAIVFDRVATVEEAMEAADRLRLAFTTPVCVGDNEIPVTASVGVTFAAPELATNAESLLREADTAMYQAKDAGRDCVAAFEEARRVAIERRVKLERELRHALERGELDVHYQPIVETATGQAVGVEALLRWTHPTLGSIPPDAFIPIAEETGLIMPIGGWVLQRACHDLKGFRSLSPATAKLYVSVNLSIRQLRDNSLLDHVARALRASDLPAEALDLELTESLIMENVVSISETLARIRSYGITIAIDDFGTGYSSLAYLQELPVDRVKIDRTFVARLGRDTSDRSLVAAVVAMTRSMGKAVIAEGVETAEQQQVLTQLGCDLAQGYYFARPAPRGELPQVIARLGVASRSGRHLHVVEDKA
jgi:diguanylate cyclase (GGDEF)-like protein